MGRCCVGLEVFLGFRVGIGICSVLDRWFLFLGSLRFGKRIMSILF